MRPVFALFLVVGLFCGLLPLWFALNGVPEIDVHGIPWRTHTGRLTQRYPVGEAFHCDADGLSRIEVALALVRRPPKGGVRLELFDEGADEALRTVDVMPGELDAPGAFVSFEFEELADSAGRRLRFELQPIGESRPGDYSAWYRVRGEVGHEGAWGWVEHEGPRIEGPLRYVYPADLPPEDFDPVEKPNAVPHPNLRALSFATRGIAPRVGEVKLELWEEGVAGPPLRTVRLGPEHEVLNGWITFGFEPILDSRWKEYRYRLSLHEQAVLLGDPQGPTMMSFHGLEGGDARLGGATRGGVLLADRDLVFRAYCEGARGIQLSRIVERTGSRLAWGSALWVISLGLLALAVSRRRGAA